MISYALKRWLVDKSVANKQQIRPVLLNSALEKLKKVNPFYSNINIDIEWEDLSD